MSKVRITPGMLIKRAHLGQDFSTNWALVRLEKKLNEVIDLLNAMNELPASASHHSESGK